jgi:hypothetical protein
MQELKREPICTCWLKQVVRFWNKIQLRPDGDLVKMAMRESYALAEAGKQCWAMQFRKSVGSDQACVAADGRMMVLPEKVIVDAATQVWRQSLSSSLPNMPPEEENVVRNWPDHVSRGFKLLTYRMWFAPDDGTPKKHRWWFHVNDKARIEALAQFRLGSHWLQVERGRYTGVPRSQRCCSFCENAARDDEMHLLQCPLYAGLRYRYFHGDDILPEQFDVASDRDMRKVMNSPADSRESWNRFAAFISQCKWLAMERAERRMGLVPE